MFQRSEKSNIKVECNCTNQTDDKERLYFKGTCKIYAGIYCDISIAVIHKQMIQAALPTH